MRGNSKGEWKWIVNEVGGNLGELVIFKLSEEYIWRKRNY